jgi:hypothetical protein
MSILSQLLSKKFGLPDVKLDKSPIAKVLIDQILKEGYDKAFAPLSNDDLYKLNTIICIEMKRRYEADKG